MRRFVSAAAVLAAVASPSAAVVLAPAAHAASPWSAPVTLSAPRASIEPLPAASSAGGGVVAAWKWTDGGERSGTSFAVRLPGATAFGPEGVLPEDTFAVVPYAQDRVIAGVVRDGGVAAAFAGPGDRVPRARTVARQEEPRRPAIAASPEGRAALAWSQDGRVWVALREPGRAFAQPLVLGRARVRDTAVAVGARGDVLVVWRDGSAIVTRLLRPAARRFERAQRLVTPAGGADVSAALSPDGRAIVAWRASEGTAMAWHAARREPGPSRWVEQKLFAQSDDAAPDRETVTPVAGGTRASSGTDPLIAFEPDGRPLISWSDLDDLARVSVLGTDGRFEDGVVQGPGRITGLAPGPLVVTQRDFPDEGLSEVWVSFRGDALRPASSRRQAHGGSGVIDAVTGRPIVLWVDRPDESGGEVVQVADWTG